MSPFGRGRLTVSVENTVTGETHREKLTLSGPGSVAGAECLLRLSGDAGGGAGAVGSAGRLPVRIPCTVRDASASCRYLPHRGRPGVGREPPDGLRGVRPGRPGQRPTESFRSGNMSPATVCVRSTGSSPPRQDAHGAGCGQAGGSPIDHLCGAPHGPPPRLADGLMEAAGSLCQAYVDQPFRLMWEQGDRLCPGRSPGRKRLPESGDGAAEKQGTGGAPARGASGGGAVLLYQLPADRRLPEDAVVLCSDEPPAPGRACAASPGGYAGNTGKMDVELGAFGEKNRLFHSI